MLTKAVFVKTTARLKAEREWKPPSLQQEVRPIISKRPTDITAMIRAILRMAKQHLTSR